ncbi:MAG: FAD-dependent oxidoreductase [Planctomycetota bacterium]
MSSGDRRRVGVLGGGIAGVSTAAFLAQEPEVEVTLVEREPRHDTHSTGRSAEILRVAVDDPVTRAMARASSALLASPSQAGLGRADLVERTGLFVVTAGNEPAWAEELEASGDAERADLERLRARAPHFVPRGDRVHWLPAGGRVRAERLVPALVRAAVARGARFVRSAGPAAVDVEAGAVRGVVLANGRRIDCDDVVVAAGAWTLGIARSMGLDLELRPTRRHMFLTSPAARHPLGAPVVWDDAAGFYARTDPDGWGISMCDVVDAAPSQAPPYPVEDAARARALSLAERHLPRAAGEPPVEVVDGWSGFRDLTPDDRPILGPDDRVAGLSWCAGLGGHGMTLSLSVGRSAAAAALGRPDPFAERCRRERFEAAATVGSPEVGHGL